MKKYLLLIMIITFSWTNEQIFVSCEGNYGENNGSLWYLFEEQTYEYSGNPIGDVVQSIYIHENNLYVIVNGSNNIQVFNINEDGLTPLQLVDTDLSGPREMIIYHDFLYFTNWYTEDVKKINLLTWEIEASISTPGLPEDIVFHDGLLYVSITMNEDWSDGNKVVSIDPNNDSIVNEYEVGAGPGNLLVHDDEIYVSRTYYDENWNVFYGTSRINLDGTILIANYGTGGASCGGGVYSYQNEVYRLYDGGVARLDDELQIMPETRIGNFNSWEVYSAEVIGEYIYFGLSDYASPDEVAIVNNEGDEVNRYEVGALPGDFAIWSSCISNGDINDDAMINILDIVIIVENIITHMTFDCHADMNSDDMLSILDIIILVDLILD